jgi:hypothetical protein
MSEQQVTLARFFDPMAAQMVKIKLEGEGIPAQLLGDTSGGLFAGLGGAFGTIEVRVAEQDLSRARELLEDVDDQLEGDDMEAGTAITARDAIREKAPSSVPQATTNDESATEPVEETGITARRSQRRKPKSDAPERVREIAWTADDLADRAWRAGVLGLFFFPIMFYAGWMLLRLSVMDGNLSPAGTRKLYGALAALGLFSFLCLSFFSLIQQ